MVLESLYQIQSKSLQTSSRFSSRLILLSEFRSSHVCNVSRKTRKLFFPRRAPVHSSSSSSCPCFLSTAVEVVRLDLLHPSPAALLGSGTLSRSCCQLIPRNHLHFLISSTPFFRLPNRFPRSAVRSFLTRTSFQILFSTGSLSSTEGSCALSPRWPPRRPAEPLFLLF